MKTKSTINIKKCSKTVLADLENTFKFSGQVVRFMIGQRVIYCFDKLPSESMILCNIYDNSNSEVILPDGFKVGGYLSLVSCDITFSDELIVAGDTYIEHCDINPISRRSRITSGGRFTWQASPNDWIQSDMSNLEICANESIDIQIRNMKIPPKIMRTNGPLSFSGCNSLSKLPDDLSVGGDLFLWGCENITEIPENARIDGEIYTRDTGISEEYIRLHDQWNWRRRVE